MPALKNYRHEQFAHELVIAIRTGGTNGEAYTRAGYKSTGPAAGASAARMLADDRNGIAKRVQEIVGRGARRAEVTVETLLDKLERNIINAEKAGNQGAINGSIKLMADLRGLLINRTEIGQPGDFAACTSSAEVLALVTEELGEETARILSEALERRERLMIEHNPAHD